MKQIENLIAAQQEKRLSVLERHLENGVVFLDLATVYIDESVEIASGVVIGPNNTLTGATRLASGCMLEANNVISDCEIGTGTRVLSSVLKDSKVGCDVTVGPFAYLRPGSEVGDGCRVGDFVELKNAKLGAGTKVSHLTYVGDAELGSGVNVGCGVVFANYDGTKKHRTVVGSDCFIGSNCNLVAPVTVADRSYIAAGTTVTKDVEADSFVIGRCRQEKLEIQSKYCKKKETL